MRLFLPLLLLISAGFAAEEPAPLLSASLPDIQRTIVRFNGSIYGTLWNDPQVAPLREKLLQTLDEQAEELGFKVSDLLLGARNAALRLRSFAASNHEPKPLGDFAMDLGALADKAFAAWKKAAKHQPAEVPGASEAFTIEDEQLLVARFDQVVAGFGHGLAPSSWAAPADEADFTLDLDGPRLLDALINAMPEGERREEARGIASTMTPYFGTLSYRSRIISEGMLEHLTTSNACPWLIPVDRAVVDRLPATSINGIAFGIDGRQLWAAIRKSFLAGLAKDFDGDEEQVLAQLDEGLSDSGFTITFSELIEGLNGTFAVAIAPSAPFPSLTIAIPRTPALDSAMATLCGFAGTQLPDENASVVIPIPNLPVQVTLALDKGHWMLTSDAFHPNDWLAGKGGLLATPAVTLALERGGAQAVLLGWSDTPNVLRMLIPYLPFGLELASDLEPDQRQAILKAIQTAATKAGTGYVVAKPQDGGLATEIRGLLTYSFAPPLFAAIAIPDLLQNRVIANEAAAATYLKSGVFPAEIQFQAGGYVDDNGNGIGDYGFFSEMSGAEIGEHKLVLALLGREWNAPTPLINGYRFAVFLPDDRDGFVDSPDGRRTVKGKAEENFVAYAWPDEEGNGRKIFAITVTGTVYAADWDGQPPAWNALWGGGDANWQNKPSWKPFRR